MNCPFCNHKDSRVLESRQSSENNAIRRRRECEACRKRFTTYERIENVQILIIKNSGNREPYSREKLRSGVDIACAKTPVTAEQIEELLDYLEMEISNSGRREVPSSYIGELIMNRLKLMNQVAYVRFASVYRQFRSAEDFVTELSGLGQNAKGLVITTLS